MSSKRFKRQNLDKPAKDLSIERLIAEDSLEPVMDENNVNDEVEIPIFTLDEEFSEKVAEYNKNVMNLDPDYAGLDMFGENMLVRAHLEEVTYSESGVITKPVTTIPIGTNSGIGELFRVESAFPYTRKAVVVAVPTGYQDKFSPGDVVVVKETMLDIAKAGAANEVKIYPRNGFVHPDGPIIVPSDPSSKHYGYLLLRPFEIVCKLKPKK